MGYKEGKEVARDVMKTAGAPADVRITPDYSEIKLGGYIGNIFDLFGRADLCPLSFCALVLKCRGMIFGRKLPIAHHKWTIIYQ